MKQVIGYILFILGIILMFGHLFILGKVNTDVAWVIRGVALGLAIVGAMLSAKGK